MKRWHAEINLTRRQWAEHRRFHLEESASGVVECPCDEQVGRFRKRDAYDCGRTQCGLCHRDKFPRRTLTRQEVTADLACGEQLRELCEE